MRHKKQFFKPKDKTAIYTAGPVGKAMVYLGTTGILTSFIMMLFSFIDSLMLIKLIPFCSHFNFETLYGTIFHHLSGQTVVDTCNQYHGTVNSSDTLIRTAVTLAYPFNMLLSGIPALYAMGVVIEFGHAKANNDQAKMQAIWTNGMHGATLFTLLMVLPTVLLSYFIIPLETQPNVVSTQTLATIIAHNGNIIHVNHQTINLTAFVSELNHYYLTAYNNTVTGARDYMFILIATMLLGSYSSLFVSVLQDEGFVLFVTWMNIASILVSMLCDFLLIYYAQLGICGAAVATVIGWFVNFIAFGLYLRFKVKDVSYKALFTNKTDGKLLLHLGGYGATIFISEIGFMIGNICFTAVLSQTAVLLTPTIGAAYYLSLVAAVGPFTGVFRGALFGYIKYASPYFSFNYSQKAVKRFQTGFGGLTLYSLLYGSIVVGIFGYVPQITTAFLSWFNITAPQMVYDGTILFHIGIGQVFLFGLAMGGMLCFLAAGRAGCSAFLNLLRVCLIYLPCVGIFQWISLKTHNMMVYYAMHPVSSAVAGLIIFVGTAIFNQKYAFLPKRQWNGYKFQFSKQKAELSA